MSQRGRMSRILPGTIRFFAGMTAQENSYNLQYIQFMMTVCKGLG
jgi:hypothetical protein